LGLSTSWKSRSKLGVQNRRKQETLKNHREKGVYKARRHHAIPSVQTSRLSCCHGPLHHVVTVTTHTHAYIPSPASPCTKIPPRKEVKKTCGKATRDPGGRKQHERVQGRSSVFRKATRKSLAVVPLTDKGSNQLPAQRGCHLHRPCLESRCHGSLHHHIRTSEERVVMF
jgi:hypothetical protein